ncbi:hypothetical protein PsYK624_038840 [Phanerochaete sordida]|uniref:Uncharacterized protein n=1 Tax=Phanerochaete sordida TaxID=48140 RepID=A0A9P3G3W6_9APHY|nr:hypothetical protein PsYK624_038840 [Phanerochaete sordida]
MPGDPAWERGGFAASEDVSRARGGRTSVPCTPSMHPRGAQAAKFARSAVVCVGRAIRSPVPTPSCPARHRVRAKRASADDDDGRAHARTPRAAAAHAWAAPLASCERCAAPRGGGWRRVRHPCPGGARPAGNDFEWGRRPEPRSRSFVGRARSHAPFSPAQADLPPNPKRGLWG